MSQSTSKIYWYFALPLSLLLLTATILSVLAERRGELSMAQSAAIVQISCVVIAVIGFTVFRPRQDSKLGPSGQSGAGSSETEEDERRADAEKKKNEWLLRLVVVTALGMCVVVFYSVQWLGQKAIQIASVGILAGGATWLIAAVVGFLFGIPHAREGEVAQGQAQPAPGPSKDNGSGTQRGNRYRPSTSLEQVSDWLTKIIVGVGLTQLGNIPKKLDILAWYIALGMGDGYGHKPFALAICLYFPAAGFLFGFLWARLYMLEAFQRAEADALDDVKRLSNRIDADFEAIRMLEQQLDEETPEVPQETLVEAFRKASGSARAQIFDKARYARISKGGTDERRRRAIPIFRALIALDTEQKFHRNHAQLGYALHDVNRDWKGAEFELSEAIRIRDKLELRGWLKYEYRRALSRINLLEAAIEAKYRAALREAILEDLRKASQDAERRQEIEADSTISEWLKKQNLTLQEVLQGRLTSSTP